MAIYHHSVSIVKRSAGKSAIAAAAYRSGQRLIDERTGIIHDYTYKTGVDKSMILSPIEADWISDRERLWNTVEATEKRCDSRLAREVTLAIPRELSRDNQIALVCEYVKINYTARGMITDINFHDLESNNPHVHMMLSLRQLKVNEHGRVEFGNKNREWDNRDLLIEQRRNWEAIANKFLADAGYDRVKIDCRSLEAQGVDRIPQIHLGFHAASMRAKGVSTRIGDDYDRIEAANNNIKSQLENIYSDELAIVDLDRECEKLHQQISDLQAEINQGVLILARMAKEKSDRTPKPPTSTDLIEMIGGDDRVKRVVQWCSKNLIIPDGENEFHFKTNLITARISAVKMDSQSIGYVLMDTFARDKLMIACDRSSGQILEIKGIVTGAIKGLISKIDNFMLGEILRDLSERAKPQITPEQVTILKIDNIGIVIAPEQVTESENTKIGIVIQAEPEIYKVETTAPDPATPERVVPQTDRKMIPRRRSNQRE